MKKTSFLLLTLFVSISVIVYFTVELLIYINRQKDNKSKISYCIQNNTDECFNRAFELLLPKILINEVFINRVEHNLIKLEYTSRIDSAYALWLSDVLLGYGVYNDMHYEEEYAQIFKKPAYAFDCGISHFQPYNPLCKFESECIASDSFLINNQISSKRIHSLSEKINELKLNNKKIFIKMDIAEGDIVGIPEILKNYKNITGFTVALHIRKPKDIIDRLHLLDEINKNFVLVSRTTLFFDSNNLAYIPKTKYYKGMLNDRVMYLSYINKNIINSYKISMLQNTDKYYKQNSTIGLYIKNQIPYSDISFIVTLTEKIKSILYKK